MSSDLDQEFKSGHKVTAPKVLEAVELIRQASPVGRTAVMCAEIVMPGNVRGASTMGGRLSTAKDAGLIVQLTETIDGDRVFVMPEDVGDRVVWPGYRHGGRRRNERAGLNTRLDTDVLEELDGMQPGAGWANLPLANVGDLLDEIWKLMGNED